ncbi:MAG: prepilin-type N-terminal cleavage/methylation domain-containing protein [Alphaproteobacteria bacterium]|nr:prepilin-type N-terminal cleavage/methylation domain-containing protein [Alphaproteobacteria bacterium]
MKRSNAGFSLIEIAIALLIIGILAVPLATAYRIEMESRRISFNNGQFTEIQKNINYYVSHSGRYPLPASLVAGPNDTEYGKEIDTGTYTIELCSSPTWTTNGGVCRTAGANPALIGSIPFQDIGVNPSYGFDYWDNKILYAVTETQTTAYAPGNGRIISQAFNMAHTLQNVFLDTDMVLISSGETQLGAYNREGTLVAACPAATDGLDSENCDFDTTFLLREHPSANDDAHGAGAASDVDGPNFYDDMTSLQRSVPVDLWRQNLVDSDYALSNARHVGIGLEDPQTRLHVVGNILSDNVLSDVVCNGSGGLCFNPNLIGGQDANMNCYNASLSGTQAVGMVENGRVRCNVPVDSGGNPISGGAAFKFPSANFVFADCGGDKLMTGIDSSGTPVCEVP